MNRRLFSTLILSGVPLLGLAPAIAYTAASSSSQQGACGWESLEQCQGLVGQRFDAIGPSEGGFELTDVIPYSNPSTHQFFVRFRTDRELPEGVYLLKNKHHSKALFLQPVEGQAGVMEAAFSLQTA